MDGTALNLVAGAFDECDSVFDRQNLFGSIIGNLAAKFFLERHDQLDRVEAVRAKIIDKTGIIGNFSPSTPRCSITFFNAIRNITHVLTFPNV